MILFPKMNTSTSRSFFYINQYFSPQHSWNVSDLGTRPNVLQLGSKLGQRLAPSYDKEYGEQKLNHKTVISMASIDKKMNNS